MQQKETSGYDAAEELSIPVNWKEDPVIRQDGKETYWSCKIAINVN